MVSFAAVAEAPGGWLMQGGVRVVSLHLLCMQQRIGGDVRRGVRGRRSWVVVRR